MTFFSFNFGPSSEVWADGYISARRVLCRTHFGLPHGACAANRAEPRTAGYALQQQSYDDGACKGGS